MVKKFVKVLKDFFVVSKGSARIGKTTIKRKQISRTKSILIVVLGFLTFIGFILGISSNVALQEIQNLLSTGG